MMEKELRALIKALAPGSMGLPVNFGVNPEGVAYPSCVLNVISSPGTHNMDGRDGLTRSRVQADVYALTYAEMVETRDAIRSSVDCYAGDEIHRAFYDDCTQTVEDGRHRARMTFFVWHA